MPYRIMFAGRGWYSYRQFVTDLGLSISAVKCSALLRGIKYRKGRKPLKVKPWSPMKIVLQYAKVELIPDPAVRKLVIDRLYRLPTPPSFRSRVDYYSEDEDD